MNFFDEIVTIASLSSPRVASADVTFGCHGELHVQLTDYRQQQLTKAERLAAREYIKERIPVGFYVIVE